MKSYCCLDSYYCLDLRSHQKCGLHSNIGGIRSIVVGTLEVPGTYARRLQTRSSTCRCPRLEDLLHLVDVNHRRCHVLQKQAMVRFVGVLLMRALLFGIYIRAPDFLETSMWISGALVCYGYTQLGVQDCRGCSCFWDSDSFQRGSK